MRKILALTVMAALLICLSACSNKKMTDSVGTAELPLKGFHGVDGNVIIETADKISFLQQEFVLVENAYHYQDGELLKLKPFETELKIGKDVSRNGEEIVIPIQYFICEGTVYAYMNVDFQSLGSASSLKLAPICRDSENILIYSGGVLGVEPIIYNVKSGKYRLLFTETETCSLSFPAGLDADGQYVAVLAGTIYDYQVGISKNYVINLNDGTSQEIPTPEYDKSKYTGCTIIPQRFIGDELLVTYEIEYAPNIEENYHERYYYDLKTGKLRKLDTDIEADLSWFSNDFLIMKSDWKTGNVQLYNFKTNQHFSYTMKPQTDITGMPNESGKFLLGEYKEKVVSFYDDNGDPVYENTMEPYTPVLINMKKGEIVDVTKYIADFTITRYKGHNIVLKQWIDETHLLITYEVENVEYTEILDLKAAME